MASVTSTFPGTVAREDALTAVLSSISFTAFTIIAVLATYYTTRNGLRRTSSIAAFAVTVVLYAVAAIYSIAVLVALFRRTGNTPVSDVYTIPTRFVIGMAALDVTIILTNAVVWSRVWVLWRHNKVVYGVSILLLLVTFLLCALFTTNGTGLQSYEKNHEMILWGFYWGSDTAHAISWMSAASNAIAFVLYLVKALKLRSEKSVSMGRVVGRHLVRVLESGALFAIIWLLMAIYEMGPSTAAGRLPTSDGFSFFVNGFLISLLGSSAVLILIFATTGMSEAAFLHDGPPDEQGVPLATAHASEKV